MSSTKTAIGRELISIHVSIIMHKIPFRSFFLSWSPNSRTFGKHCKADLKDAYKNGCMKQKLQLNVQLAAYANHKVCKTRFCMHIFAWPRLVHHRPQGLQIIWRDQHKVSKRTQPTAEEEPEDTWITLEDPIWHVNNTLTTLAWVKMVIHLMDGKKYLIKGAWKIKGMVNNRDNKTLR